MPTAARITPILLCAGDSSRMGHPKAILPLGNTTFLGRIAQTLVDIGLCDPLIVVGKHGSRIRAVHSHLEAVWLVNEDPARGQLSSIQLALKRIPDSSEGCLVWPVDQPGVPTEVVGALVGLFQKRRPLLALPICQNTKGHPALFGRELFDEILETPLETGAKPVVRKYQQETSLLETESTETIIDIDTPEDYLQFTGVALDQALAGR